MCPHVFFYFTFSGPLHLLPPVGLEALSFVTDEKDAINRCVTLWAYIDERNGKLLDAGLERVRSIDVV